MSREGRKDKDKEIGSLINKVMRSWGLEDRMKEMDIVNAWPDLMGKGVAYRTEKLYIRNKILHIKLNSSVMRDELQYGKSVIIQRVNEFAGMEMVNDVWFE